MHPFARNLSPCQMKDLAKVRSVWHAIRHGAAVPARADLVPLALGPTLQVCFLAEKSQGNGARFRLVGRGLNDAYGMDLRAIPLTALVAGPLQRAFASSVDAVFDHAALLFAQYGTQNTTTPPRSLMLQPLRDVRGRTTLALGLATGFATGAILGDLDHQIQGALLPTTQLDSPSQHSTLREPGPDWKPAPPAHEKGAHQSARPKFTVIKGGK